MIKAGHSEDLLRLLDLLIPGISEPAHAAELQLLKARALDVRGELDQAVALYGEILRLESQPDLQAKAADAHRYLGDILRRGGQLDSADQHLEAALRVYKSLNHGEGQAEALLAVGQLAEDRADYPRAERLYERTIELARTLGLRDREAEAHFAFSRLLSIRGDPVQSLERKRRALAIAEGLADWHLQARFQVALGTNLYELKRYEEAVLAYEQGIETARRIGDLRMLAYGVYNASLSFLTAGDHQRAESHLKEADVLFRKLREPVMAGLVLLNYGYLWEKREKWQLAKQNFLSGLRSLRDGGHDLDFARHALTVAGYMQKYGEHEAAIGIAQDALGVSRQLRIPSLADRAERFISEEEESSRRAGARRDVNDVATS
jgi:tetratricopeptide (TPR) repeat protein